MSAAVESGNTDEAIWAQAEKLVAYFHSANIRHIASGPICGWCGADYKTPTRDCCSRAKEHDSSPEFLT